MSKDEASSTSEWFNTWFNTPYYDLLYGHRGTQEASDFVQRIYQKLDMYPGATVLDMPCGWGRHSQVLHRLGLRATGADINADLIDRARNTASKGLTFKVHDMRQPYPGGGFDYVLNLFTSLGYFKTDAENQAVLKGLTSVLKPNGQLLIDFLNADRIKMQFKPFETRAIKGIRFQIRRQIRNNYIRKDVQIEDQGKQLHFLEQVMLYDVSWFSAALEACGMKVTGCYGDYHFTPFEPTCSERLLITARLR